MMKRINKPKHLKTFKPLKTDNMTVFICPAATKLPLYSVFVRLAVNFGLQGIEEESTIPDTPALICIDEFPVFHRLQSIEVFSGYIRSFHAKFLLIAQNLKQIQSTYPQAWENFLGNLTVHGYGNSELTTLRYFEERLGKTAIETTSTNISTQAAIGNQTRSYQLFSLMTGPEMSRIFGAKDHLKRQLYLEPSREPIILQRVEYWNRNTAYFEQYFRAYWEFMGG